MTNQEINEAVARKLGIELGNLKPRDYATDIKAAWDLLTRLAPKGGVVRIEGPYFDGWEVVVTDEAGFQHLQITRAETAPLAICKVFLKPEG